MSTSIDTALNWPDGPSEAQPLDKSLADINTAIAGDRPLMYPPDDSSVELVRGIYDASGSPQTVAVIRELTGADEEQLARFRNSEDVRESVVALGVESIGNLNLSDLPLSGRRDALKHLLVGEHWQLLLAIIRATFGNEKEMKFTCPSCQTEHDTTLLLDEDFKLTVPEGGVSQTGTYTTKRGSEITFRMVSVGDISSLPNRKGVTSPEVNTALLSSVIISVDDKPLLLDKEGFVKSLSIFDRQKLLETIASSQPSMDMTLNIECVGCGKEASVPVNWEELFRP